MLRRALPVELEELRGTAEQASEKLIVLEGHGFSRAESGSRRCTALAADGRQVTENAAPQGLKPKHGFTLSAARLKSCPFKAAKITVQMSYLAACKAVP
jgi:hypothetical protein